MVYPEYKWRTIFFRAKQRPPIDTEYTTAEKIAIVKSRGVDPRDHTLDTLSERPVVASERYNGEIGNIRNREIEQARWRPGTLRLFN